MPFPQQSVCTKPSYCSHQLVALPHPWLDGTTQTPLSPAAVHVRQGKIVSVIKPGPDTANITYLELFRQRTSKLTGTSRWLDVGDAVVSPGLIDTHVHFDEPGREHWEGEGVLCVLSLWAHMALLDPGWL